MNNKLLSILALLAAMLVAGSAYSEIRVFERESTWKAAKNQSQEQAEKIAIVESQRKAIEEVGTFISSQAVVKMYFLDKDEVSALASGIFQAKIIGIPKIFTCYDTFCVTVKTMIEVDTLALVPQVDAFVKDKGIREENERLKAQLAKKPKVIEFVGENPESQMSVVEIFQSRLFERIFGPPKQPGTTDKSIGEK